MLVLSLCCKPGASERAAAGLTVPSGDGQRGWLTSHVFRKSVSLGMIMPLWSTGKSASPDCKSQRKGTHWGLTVTPESTGREGGKSTGPEGRKPGSAPTHS